MDKFQLIKNDMLNTIESMMSLAYLTKQWLHFDMNSIEYKKAAKHLLKIEIYLRYAKTKIKVYNDIMQATYIMKFANDEMDQILSLAE
ncbi:MAG: hypothetical protein PVJ67_05210 [Candidatus Pacearchaeota archaeon]|jgi:hypothetical protein